MTYFNEDLSAFLSSPRNSATSVRMGCMTEFSIADELSSPKIEISSSLFSPMCSRLCVRCCGSLNGSADTIRMSSAAGYSPVSFDLKDSWTKSKPNALMTLSGGFWLRFCHLAALLWPTIDFQPKEPMCTRRPPGTTKQSSDSTPESAKASSLESLAVESPPLTSPPGRCAFRLLSRR